MFADVLLANYVLAATADCLPLAVHADEVLVDVKLALARLVKFLQRLTSYFPITYLITHIDFK